MTETRMEQEERESVELSDLLSGVIDARARIAQWQATEAQLLAEAGRIGMAQTRRISSGSSQESAMPFRSVAAEFGAGMRISDRTAQADIDDAMTVVNDYPRTFSAWHEGTITRTHVTAIMNAGAVLTDRDARAQFDETIAPVAQTSTPGKVRRRAVTLVEKAQPRTLTERHREAREERCVRVFNLPDGMAQVEAIVPALLAHGIFDRITRQARALKDAALRAAADGTSADGTSADGTSTDGPTADGTSVNGSAAEGTAAGLAADGTAPGDHRTMDQMRADLFADMLLTSAPTVEELAGIPGDASGGLGAIRAIVQVTVPVTTLAGSSETPGDLTGRALVDPASARRLAGNAPGWDRVFTHPVTGGVLTVDRYRPSDHLKRHLRARDQHCRFPGCRMPVTRCDIDHTLDAALGGPTNHQNLAHLCRRHHTLKHASAWKLTQTGDGILTWTSPTGRTYIDKPPGVEFVPTLPESDENPPEPALVFRDTRVADEPPWAESA